ncbi:NAD(P)-dependent oxidoreductase [Defluviimonas salinarum]|uniref:NAD(P)-binding domain-containing protein n=1 Tax=Defluviimonas salinarum TaxID=2992147 RepID=A0ABT3J306_9RHOB|nr:NAD(P)-binding domain-containing protein [Defluviimonas salinarum]MCW3782061.1 NAD(P)-binding domain-containing protein [Defluviimonas salinarum]
MSDITVVGLGAMGSALARTLIAAGRDVTVWNRSPEKMRPLVAAGAEGAATLGAAVSASPRTIVCIPDYQSTAGLFEQPDVGSALKGRTVIQLSTGTPREAAGGEAWFGAHGAAYLDGAILCWPGDIGTPKGLMLVAGPAAAFEASRADLQPLAGDLRYLGANIRAASTLDLAFLSRLTGIIFGSIHGAMVCEAEGVPVEAFTALLPAGDRSVPLTQTISAESFAHVSKGGATVDVAGSAVTRMRQQAKDAGINSELPDLLCNWVRRAQDAGYGSEETAAVIKALRSARDRGGRQEDR